MKKMFKPAVCSVLVFVAAIALPYINARADETRELEVTVKTYDNETVAAKRGGIIYSPVPVRFIPQGTGEISYSISTDDGVTFGTYIKMNTEDVMLFPDDDTAPEGRWQIRFRERSGEEEVLSDLYRVTFDTVVPVLDFNNPEVLSDTMTGEERAEFTASDDIGISRVIAKCDDDVIFEMHRGEEDGILTEQKFSFGLTDPIAGIRKVDVSCTDLAGNSSVVTFEYGNAAPTEEQDAMPEDEPPDTTAPQVDIIGVTDNVDLRGPVTVTVDVTEDNYEDSKVDITLIRSVPEGTDSIRMDSYVPEAYRDMRTISIAADGQYRLDVSVRDGAGNRTDVSRVFRMDSTAPSVSITGIAEGEVTAERSTLRFCAGELFHDSTIMTAVLERFENGAYTTVSTDMRVMGAVRDHMDVAVTKEGRYRLTCMAADRSGNSSSTSVDFTVDYTPPVISGIGDINNRFFKTFALPGKISELVYDLTNVSAEAYINDTGIKDGDVIIEDGKYVLTILAEDEAGNRSEDSAVFMVDHTSPQIVLGGFDRNGNIQKGSLITVGLAEEGDRLVSVRFNDRNVSISPDNKAVIGVDDYGRYTLEIKAEDSAGNVTDTTVVTDCYMYGASFLPYAKTETVIRSDAGAPEEDDVDLKGLFAGLIPVLTGTFGLAYRTYLRD